MSMDGANDGRPQARRVASGRPIRYTLAGQINATPMGPPNGTENGILEDSVYSDVDYRRALGPTHGGDEVESPSVQFETDSPTTIEKKTSASTGWSTLALQVVGKVWEFCKMGTFRGFYAGGGTGYAINPPSTPAPPQGGKQWCNEHDIPSLPNDDAMANQTPMETPFETPNQFPQQEFSFQQPLQPDFPRQDFPIQEFPRQGFPRQDSFQAFPKQASPPAFPTQQFPRQDFTPFSPYQELSTPESTPRPAAKRRQVSGHNDELKKNWVLVDEPSDAKPQSFGAALAQTNGRPVPPRRSTGSSYYSHTAASAGRRINAPSSRLNGIPSNLPRSRASLRISHAGSPNLAPAPTTASFAAPRSPVRTTPSRIPVPVSFSSSQPTNSNPPALPSFGPKLTTTTSRPNSRQSIRPISRQSLSRPSLGLPVHVPPSPTKTQPFHRRTGSNASAAPTSLRRSRNTLVDVDDIHASPRLDAEAKVLAQRKIAAERDTDALVDAFNMRLLSMIQQGREALGTKIEVEGEGEGEGGWEDDL